MNDIVSLEGIFENGYGFIAKQVMQDRNICLAAKGLYSYICSFSGKGEDAFPSRSKITYDLNISNDTLGKYLKQLTEHGYLTVTQKKDKGKFGHNVYRVNLFKKPCPKISDTENSVSEESDTNNNNITNNNINNKESKKERKSNIVDLLEIPKVSSEPKNPKKNQKSKEDNRTYDDILNTKIQDEDLKNCFKEFIKMRKMIKAPLTNYALERAIEKVRKLAPGDIQKQKDIVNESVDKSWKGLFPLKEQSNTTTKNFDQRTYTQKDFDNMYANKRVREAAAYENL